MCLFNFVGGNIFDGQFSIYQSWKSDMPPQSRPNIKYGDHPATMTVVGVHWSMRLIHSDHYRHCFVTIVHMCLLCTCDQYCMFKWL